MPDNNAVVETVCDAIEETRDARGPSAAIDRLIETLETRGNFRALLDALLLQARFELALPLVPQGGLNDLQDPERSKYEERYVTAIRSVGRKLLDRGEIAAAWPYYRVLGENAPIVDALERFEYQTPETYDPEATDTLGPIIDVAFGQGVHPRKGWDLILDNHGPCAAISAFDQLPPDETVRRPCAGRLVKHIHAQVLGNLRADIARRGEPEPPENASIPEILQGRAWLFEEDNYHVDVSHLSATVRMSPILNDPEALALAVELTEYGRLLSDRHRFEGEPPFEDVYVDHYVYLQALLNINTAGAIAHFRGKVAPRDDSWFDVSATLPAQVLILLLVRAERFEAAISVFREHLLSVPESSLICLNLASLCLRAQRLDLLAEISRERDDAVTYLSALLESKDAANKAS